jgi:hypothetical protein
MSRKHVEGHIPKSSSPSEGARIGLGFTGLKIHQDATRGWRPGASWPMQGCGMRAGLQRDCEVVTGHTIIT